MLTQHDSDGEQEHIHFKQSLLPNCLPHDLEIVTVNEGDSTS